MAIGEQPGLLLLSDLRQLDYVGLSGEFASKLGINAYSSPEGFYRVFLSGRPLRLDPASIGAVGVSVSRIGFAAYVPGSGWVVLPCRVYDSEVYINGSIVTLLDSGYIYNDTVIEVKLPT